jgi:hypothetical protein
VPHIEEYCANKKPLRWALLLALQLPAAILAARCLGSSISLPSTVLAARRSGISAPLPATVLAAGRFSICFPLLTTVVAAGCFGSCVSLHDIRNTDVPDFHCFGSLAKFLEHKSTLRLTYWADNDRQCHCQGSHQCHEEHKDLHIDGGWRVASVYICGIC